MSGKLKSNPESIKGVDVDVAIKNGPQAQRQFKQIADQSNRAAQAAGSMGKALGIYT